MTEGEMIAFLGALLGLIVAIMTPIIRLNTTITKLNSNLEYEHQEGERQNHVLDAHAERIDILETKATNHEVRIAHLENRRE